MGQRLVTCVGLGLTAILGLAGCTASHTSAATPQKQTSAGVPPDTTRAGSDAIELPGPTSLHPFFLSPTESVVIEQATDVLTAKCMKKMDYTYAVPRYADRVAAAVRWSDEAESRLYGPTNPQTARRFGLGIDLSGGSAQENGVEPQPGASYLIALLGSESSANEAVEDPARLEADRVKTRRGGCLGEARLQITGSSDGLPREVGRRLWIQASVDAQQSPRYSAVTDDYTSCMKSAGYRVTAVLDDKGDTRRFKRDLASTKPSRGEIVFALTQVRCKKQIDLVPRLHSIDEDYSARAVKEHRVALRNDRRHIDSVLKIARHVLHR